MLGVHNSNAAVGRKPLVLSSRVSGAAKGLALVVEGDRLRHVDEAIAHAAKSQERTAVAR
jgi:hypothetical protein